MMMISTLSRSSTLAIPPRSPAATTASYRVPHSNDDHGSREIPQPSPLWTDLKTLLLLYSTLTAQQRESHGAEKTKRATGV